MGIPVGKLALYTVAAGIHPSQTLPISLDVGTDNVSLLEDPLYLGWRHRRLRGDRYYEIIEEFVEAVQQRFPRALLQWEDFKKSNAITLMQRYRERILSFNDDVQGTAAVAVAGVLAGLRAIQGDLKRQRSVILGAGAAGIGIARQLREALRQAGLQRDELTRSIAVLDSRGLLFEGREFHAADAYKREFAWPEGMLQSEGLTEETAAGLTGVVEALKPSVLIGTSGQPGTFTEDIIRSMASHCERPIIFPFSNPTDKSEAHPRDLLQWTEGRALVATGSPFDPVRLDGRTVRIGQGNNVFVFPGIGLGALVSEVGQVTDSMFHAASEMLAQSVSQQDLESGTLFPRLSELRPVSARIAQAVVRTARDSGAGIQVEDQEIEDLVVRAMWKPAYPRMVAV
jgi:malic enzyme